MVVEKGDRLSIPIDSLGQQTVDVKWQQNFGSRNAKYVIAEYDNQSKHGHGEDSGQIFIQESKLNEFKRLAPEGAIQVDDRFQYGQQKDGTHRFAVYHDKDNKPFQHRFVEPALVKYGNLAGRMSGQAGQAVDVAKCFMGDYLHNF